MSNSKKPRLTENEEQGRFGENYVKLVIESGWRCIFNPREGYPDRGFDGSGRVIDQHGGRVTAIEFNVQVKTSKFHSGPPDNSYLTPHIDREHLELYQDSNVPVVIICVDVVPPTRAFWRLLKPGEAAEALQKRKRIRVSTENIFGPDSRDAIITEIQDAYPRRVPPIRGTVLGFPIQEGIRDAAKDYYYRRLMPTPHDNPTFGPVQFTWKGWRHITRQVRSRAKIPSSLLLLPCVRGVLDSPVLPIHWRPLPQISRGSRIEYRTLLVFERVVMFRYRAPAWVRVVIQRRLVLPTDYILSPPNDPRRTLDYKFLSISELPRPVTSADLPR